MLRRQSIYVDSAILFLSVIGIQKFSALVLAFVLRNLEKMSVSRSISSEQCHQDQQESCFKRNRFWFVSFTGVLFVFGGSAIYASIQNGTSGKYEKLLVAELL